ncbi:TetR/AcrR family transcriptional regulator [Streptomyces sp. CA-294286]|uniref:TetR/AcrR family transcriptional regulator n=1 Tax=Streptomyces sp. CA-294286 TaxID=3240070 RepID=UPI003D94CB5C
MSDRTGRTDRTDTSGATEPTGDAEGTHEVAAARKANLRPSLELLWGTGERPARGPKRGLSLDRIVETAVRIADAEGLDTLSMRRLATELGTGTMSLYRYVPGKTELLDLMLDHVQGEGVELHDPGAAKDWREAAALIARGTLDLHRRHPWLLRVNQSRALLGPRSLHSLEVSLAGLRGMTGFTDPELISVIIALHSFATGIARLEVEATEAVEETGIDHESFWEGQQPYLERAMASGKYPVMAGLAHDAFTFEFDHFEFGLGRILDGFEVRVAGRGAKEG